LVREVPFVVNDDAVSVSRSVFLSAVLTAVIRASLDAAPLHAFNAPTAGTGKSMVQETIAILLTGDKPIHITAQKDEGELEKKLGASLRANGVYLSLDNCTITLDGALFCQLITQEWVNIRILGKSEVFTIKNTAMFLANGNNLTVKADMVRRVLRSTLNADCESPENREFTSERPDVLAMRNRPELIVGALTALKAFLAAGQPGQTAPLGSFEQWSRTVRDALVWYGEPAPVLSMEETRAEDPERMKTATLMREWWKVIKDDKVRVKQVLDVAFKLKEGNEGTGFHERELRNLDFKEALVAVADNGVGRVDKQDLANWLGKHKNRIIDGFKIVSAGKLDGYPRWQVINMNAESEPAPEPEPGPMREFRAALFK
jgi:putative DNA primase/helicase